MLPRKVIIYTRNTLKKLLEQILALVGKNSYFRIGNLKTRELISVSREIFIYLTFVRKLINI